MLPRRLRLSRETIPAALKSGRRISSEHFAAVVPQIASGYAIILSKKTARLSTTRHRIKRRVAAALRSMAAPPALILFPKASVLQLDDSHLRAELAVLLSKIR